MFRLEIVNLYQMLEKHGMTIPKIEPDESFYTDDTLYNFHLSTLQELSRLIRYGNFNLEKWNDEIVERERRREETAALGRSWNE